MVVNKNVTKILLTKYQTNIDNLFKDNRKMRELTTYIANYMDKNSEQLYYMAPTKKVQFNISGKDGMIVLDSLGIDPKELQRDINSIEGIKPWADVLKKPIHVALTMILREATKRKNKKLEDAFMMYLVMSFYWSLQNRQFPYEYNESLVRYTVNNLSTKFLFKTTGSTFGALYATAETNHNSGKDILLSEDDTTFLTYIMRIRDRLSSLLKRFTGELEKNRKDSKFLNTVKDEHTETTYIEIGNISGAIDNLVRSCMLRITQTGVDPKLVRLSNKFGNIPPNVFMDVIRGAITDHPDKVEQMIKFIIVDYIRNEHSFDQVGSKDFILESLKITSKSNSKDKELLKLKDNMDAILSQYSEVYATTKRAATIISYRKPLLGYFVLHITKVSNGR